MIEQSPEPSEKELIDFLKEVFALDQSKLTRDDAPECLRMLKERETDFHGTALEAQYWRGRSFESFHCAQSILLRENDIDAVRAYLQESVEAASKSGDKPWTDYVEATLFHVNNDPDGIDRVIKRGNAKDANLRIMKNMLKGLRTRGFPDYSQDYSNR